MRPYIELYIDGQPVKFTDPPRVLITYAHTDLHNPTVVKNSFSKTITVDGTPENNRIFGCFYDMTKITAYDEISVSGGFFNPSKKVPFVLYRNGEPMEEGYVKLDKVTKTGNKIQYNITLFGGLGEFLYNLQYKEDGEQMKLSDLDYGGGDKEFDMEVNKDTVKAAWCRVTELSDSWLEDTYKIYDTINFAPCYNGLPENFTADKVAIDVNSFQANNPQLYKQFVTSKDGYTTVNGWIMGELGKEYDEWQMKDLRSYLQRPVFRFKEVVKACCDPKNNGGYNVALDEDFFNTDNPYYENAWMTLPLLTELETVETGEDVTVKVGDTITVSGLKNNQVFSIKVQSKVGCKANSTATYLQTAYYGSSWDGSDESAVVDESTNFTRYIQLIAYDKNGKKVAGSNVNSFYSYGSWNYFEYDPEIKSTINRITGGYYKEEDGTYTFNKTFYDFSIKNLKYTEGMYFKFVEKFTCDSSPSVGWPSTTVLYTDTYDRVNVTSYTNAINEEVEIKETKGMNWYINKKSLLNSENTPCDYFLSYLKMFNLHIWKDMYEKTIYVKKRQNFFTDEVKDLEDFVDRGKTTTITPLTFENKWLVMANDGVESGLFKDYKDEYGLDYGIQKMDTNYNFDNSSKNIFEKSVFKSAIQNRGKSKYYTNIYQAYEDDDVFYPPFLLDGLQTFLYNGDGDTTEGAYITPKNSQKSINWWTEKYYDNFPKPNFSGKKNESVEGANVLLFYSGRQLMEDVEGNRMRIAISDDIPQFEILNEGEPCWIWTMDWDVAIDYMNYFPIFSRYLINENNWVTHSWDFGTPKALYIPDYNIDETSSIYTQYWKPYIRDMYNVDTRVVENSVLLLERVIGDWLRRFYYFDGSYWLLNKITDYDVTSDETTRCEFIRVNNIQNYLD